jgi:hypothetical protein
MLLETLPGSIACYCVTRNAFNPANRVSGFWPSAKTQTGETTAMNRTTCANSPFASEISGSQGGEYEDDTLSRYSAA